MAVRVLGAVSVYFIQAGPSGPIKIGSARDVRARIRTLQTGCPDDLVLLAEVRGGRVEELQLHGEFGRLRIQGEWFRPDDQLIDFIVTAVDPPGWEAMLAAEPSLMLLEADVMAFQASEVSCPLSAWYRTFKPQLVNLVGWRAQRFSIASSSVYSVAYRHLLNLLPPCAPWCIDCGDGLDPEGDPDVG